MNYLQKVMNSLPRGLKQPNYPIPLENQTTVEQDLEKIKEAKRIDHVLKGVVLPTEETIQAAIDKAISLYPAKPTNEQINELNTLLDNIIPNLYQNTHQNSEYQNLLVHNFNKYGKPILTSILNNYQLLSQSKTQQEKTKITFNKWLVNDEINLSSLIESKKIGQDDIIQLNRVSSIISKLKSLDKNDGHKELANILFAVSPNIGKELYQELKNADLINTKELYKQVEQFLQVNSTTVISELDKTIQRLSIFDEEQQAKLLNRKFIENAVISFLNSGNENDIDINFSKLKELQGQLVKHNIDVNGQIINAINDKKQQIIHNLNVRIAELRQHLNQFHKKEYNFTQTKHLFNQDDIKGNLSDTLQDVTYNLTHQTNDKLYNAEEIQYLLEQMSLFDRNYNQDIANKIAQSLITLNQKANLSLEQNKVNEILRNLMDFSGFYVSPNGSSTLRTPVANINIKELSHLPEYNGILLESAQENPINLIFLDTRNAKDEDYQKLLEVTKKNNLPLLSLAVYTACQNNVPEIFRERVQDFITHIPMNIRFELVKQNPSNIDGLVLSEKGEYSAISDEVVSFLCDNPTVLNYLNSKNGIEFIHPSLWSLKKEATKNLLHTKLNKEVNRRLEKHVFFGEDMSVDLTIFKSLPIQADTIMLLDKSRNKLINQLDGLDIKFDEIAQLMLVSRSPEYIKILKQPLASSVEYALMKKPELIKDNYFKDNHHILLIINNMPEIMQHVIKHDYHLAIDFIKNQNKDNQKTMIKKFSKEIEQQFWQVHQEAGKSNNEIRKLQEKELRNNGILIQGVVKEIKTPKMKP